jgi:hypothetical protein
MGIASDLSSSPRGISWGSLDRELLISRLNVPIYYDLVTKVILFWIDEWCSSLWIDNQ